MIDPFHPWEPQDGESVPAGIAPVLAGFLVTVLLATCLLAGGARGHEFWISRDNLHDPVSGEHCCNEHDCFDYAPEDVRLEPGGYRLRTSGELIPHERVLPNRDPNPASIYFRCATPGNRTYCFFVRPSG